MLDLDKEAARFDPDGEYVRRWLPVLSRLPTQYIHKPWLAPHTVLAAADVELGYNYPERIITADVSRKGFS
jgi:deoxyribodipyrimidine photolyase